MQVRLRAPADEAWEQVQYTNALTEEHVPHKRTCDRLFAAAHDGVKYATEACWLTSEGGRARIGPRLMALFRLYALSLRAAAEFPGVAARLMAETPGTEDGEDGEDEEEYAYASDDDPQDLAALIVGLRPRVCASNEAAALRLVVRNCDALLSRYGGGGAEATGAALPARGLSPGADPAPAGSPDAPPGPVATAAAPGGPAPTGPVAPAAAARRLLQREQGLIAALRDETEVAIAEVTAAFRRHPGHDTEGRAFATCDEFWAAERQSWGGRGTRRGTGTRWSTGRRRRRRWTGSWGALALSTGATARARSRSWPRLPPAWAGGGEEAGGKEGGAGGVREGVGGPGGIEEGEGGAGDAEEGEGGALALDGGRAWAA